MDKKAVEKMLQQRKYILKGELGHGGQARVYLVQKQGYTGEEYQACKIGKRERLETEGRLLRSIQHPCFPRYIDYWQWEQLGVLLMEYIAGKNLEEWLRQEKIPFLLVDSWSHSLVEAVECLHNMPEVWIYRDLKPSNVIIRRDGKLKLIDMGCACPISCVAKSVAGTPGYCAPEQLCTPEQVGIYSDYYGLGKIIDRLLAQSCPKGICGWGRYFKWRRFCKRCLRVEIEKRNGITAIFEKC